MINFWQTFRSERAVERLQGKIAPTATVAMGTCAALAAALLLSGAAGGSPPPAGSTSPELHAETSAKASPPPPPTGVSSWFVIPLLFWLPETRLGLGATGGVHFFMLKAQRPSSAFAVAAYTLRRQVIVSLATDLYFPGGSVLATSWRVSHFPDVYYGLGPTSPASSRDPYTRRYAEAIVSPEYALLGGRLRGGPHLEARAEDVRDELPGGVLSVGTTPGAAGFTAAGIGGSITWDTRDRPLFPSHGAYVQALAVYYPGSVGARHDAFTRGGLEARFFLPLGLGRVLGAAAFVERASAETPFTLLPKLGSPQHLRGWPEGRYRDLLAWSAQAELRVPLAYRIIGVAFAGVGDVGKGLDTLLHSEALKVAAGVGLRYQLTPEGANVRFDFAVSDAGPQAYLLLFEAF